MYVFVHEYSNGNLILFFSFLSTLQISLRRYCSSRSLCMLCFCFVEHDLCFLSKFYHPFHVIIISHQYCTMKVSQKRLEQFLFPKNENKVAASPRVSFPLQSVDVDPECKLVMVWMHVYCRQVSHIFLLANLCMCVCACGL